MNFTLSAGVGGPSNLAASHALRSFSLSPSCWTKMAWLRSMRTSCGGGAQHSFPSQCAALNALHRTWWKMLHATRLQHLYLSHSDWSEWRWPCHCSIHSPCRKTEAPPLPSTCVAQWPPTSPSSPRRVLCQGLHRHHRLGRSPHIIMWMSTHHVPLHHHRGHTLLAFTGGRQRGYGWSEWCAVHTWCETCSPSSPWQTWQSSVVCMDINIIITSYTVFTHLCNDNVSSYIFLQIPILRPLLPLLCYAKSAPTSSEIQTVNVVGREWRKSIPSSHINFPNAMHSIHLKMKQKKTWFSDWHMQ